MKITVAGVGYVGLVTAVTLTHIKHNVTCVDVNEKKIELMKKGTSPIYEKDCVVVVKSTVPIGTNDEVEKYLKEHVKPKLNVYIASNPEFLAQGTAVRDTLYASRIIVGIEDEAAKKIMEELYEPLTKEPYNVSYTSIGREVVNNYKFK